MYNECLRAKIFPNRWKRAKWISLYKGQNLPILLSSSYRPICLIDTAGKILDRFLLLADSTTTLKRWKCWVLTSFRRGRSTLEAITMVIKRVKLTVGVVVWNKDLSMLVNWDVRNAFITAPWLYINKIIRTNNTHNYLLGLLWLFLENITLIFPGMEGSNGKLRKLFDTWSYAMENIW